MIEPPGAPGEATIAMPSVMMNGMTVARLIGSWFIRQTAVAHAVIVTHQDKPGVVAYITKCLSDRNVNIAFMRLFRESKGEIAYTIVESDGRLPEDIGVTIRQHENIHEVMIVQM